jgi:hypothetical protein
MLGTVRRTDLLRALEVLGGEFRHKGGEVLVWFPGTTVTIGRRRHYGLPVIRRVERKLQQAGIQPEELMNALQSK